MTKFQRILCAGVALAGFAGLQPAAAQQVAQGTAASEGLGLEEIVVTARRREESLQSVPVAVTALGADFLADASITTAQNLQAVVPSLNISSGNSRDINRFAIRGQGVVVFADPGVITYFSEVPLLSGGAGPGYYYDLANIQVLNGPQGTLFGRNTTGGAVLFEPKKPNLEKYEGYIQGQLGNYNNRAVEGAINVPLVPGKLALRVAAQRETRDGFTKDVNTGRDYDNVNYWGARATLTFKPTDNIENLLMYYAVRSRNHGTGTILTNVNPAGAALRLFPTFGSLLEAQQARGIRDTALGPQTKYKTHTYAVTDILNWDITDDIALKNIFSYQNFKTVNQWDLDGTPLPILDAFDTGDWNNTSAPMTSQAFTEELQFSGKLYDGALSWLVGGFINYEEPNRRPEYGVTSLLVPGSTSAIQRVRSFQVLRSHAVYTQETLDIGKLVESLDGLHLTGGYRFTRDWKYRGSGARLPLGNSCAIAGLVSPDCTGTAAAYFRASTYTVSLDYQFRPDTMAYITRRTGFKSGGFNIGLPPAVPVAVKPEKIEDLEIGFKTDLDLGGVATRLNVAGFHQTYKDIQRNQFFTDPATLRLLTALANAASAKIDGVDVQTTIRPTEDLELSANWSYLYARYKKFTSPTAGVIDGQTLPFSPRNAFNASATYHLPIDDALGDLSATARFSYQSSVRGADESTPGVVIGGYGLLNLSVNWDDFMGYQGLDAGFFLTNALNRDYKVIIDPYYQSIGFNAAAYGEPRMFGFSLRYSFGS